MFFGPSKLVVIALTRLCAHVLVAVDLRHALWRASCERQPKPTTSLIQTKNHGTSASLRTPSAGTGARDDLFL